MRVSITFPSVHQLGVRDTAADRACVLVNELVRVLPDLVDAKTGEVRAWLDVPDMDADSAQYLDLGWPYEASLELSREVRAWLEGRRPAPETETFEIRRRLR